MKNQTALSNGMRMLENYLVNVKLAVTSLASMLFLMATCGKKRGAAKARPPADTPTAVVVVPAASSKIPEIKTARAARPQGKEVKEEKKKQRAESRAFRRMSLRGKIRHMITTHSTLLYYKMFPNDSVSRMSDLIFCHRTRSNYLLGKSFHLKSKWQFMRMPEVCSSSAHSQAEKGAKDTSCVLLLRELVKKFERHVVILTKAQGIDCLFTNGKSECGEFTLHCKVGVGLCLLPLGGRVGCGHDWDARGAGSLPSQDEERINGGFVTSICLQRVAICTQEDKKICHVQVVNYAILLEQYRMDSFTMLLCELLLGMFHPMRKAAIFVADSEVEVARVAFCILVLHRVMMGSPSLIEPCQLMRYALGRSIEISKGTFQPVDLKACLVALLECCCFKEKVLERNNKHIPKAVFEKRKIIQKYIAELDKDSHNVWVSAKSGPEPPCKSKVL